ncbi:hypothetical protein ATERTT37_006273 [Aspergillus terreus]
MKWPSFIPRNKFDTGGHYRFSTDADAEKAGTVDSPVPFLTWRSFFLGAFVSIGGIIFGYDTGQISGFLEMDNFKRRFGQLQSDGTWKFSNVRSGLIVAMLSIGTLLGALMAGPLADRIGRKWSIAFWCVILHVGLIIQISSPAPKWYQVMMGRFVTGFGVGACSLLVPMYQGESAPRQVRGAMVWRSSYQLFVTLGIFVAYCINFGTESMDNSGSWRIPLGITFLWGLILGIGIIFFPESPRYDFRHGRVDQAKKTMTKLYGVPANHRVIIDELAEIKEQLDAESAGKGGWHGWIEMFQGPRMPYRIFLGVTLQALQQLTGANYFFYYGTVVFNGAGISNTYVTQMILGGVNFGTTFGGLPMVWAICAELYPSRYRSRAMAMSTASNWLWNFLIGFFTPFITGDIDFAYGYVFAGCLFVAVGVVYFCVLEGRGKTLEEMDMMYIMRVPPWKSSKWVPPPPEHQVTTAQMLDRRAAEGMQNEEDRSKQTSALGTGHEHVDESGAGPSS